MSCKNWSEKSDYFSTEDLRFEEQHSPYHSKKHKGLNNWQAMIRGRETEKTEQLF